jgi:AAA15 family ATPase/GTPase
MLLEFKVSNFRSIKENQVLSMFPSTKLRKRFNILSNAENYPNLKALNSIGLYGPNNSGKSNILKSFLALQYLVKNSHRLNKGEELEPNEFFKLNKQTLEKPTFIEVDFIASDNLRYRYMVEFSRKRIEKEKLDFYPLNESGKKIDATLFSRNADKEVYFGPKYKGDKGIRFLENQLFLSKAVQEDQEQLDPAYLFFTQNINISIFHDHEYDEILLSNLGAFIRENSESPVTKIINEIISQVDVGILGLEVGANSMLPTIEFPEEMRIPKDVQEKMKQDLIKSFKNQIKTKHRFFDSEKEIGTAALSINEQSTGTIKFFNILFLILKALSTGNLLLVDELDKSLHTDLTKVLINLFNNPETNPKKAQLIFVTHDAGLMDEEVFDRDQIYLMEKNIYGASELFSVSSFENVRQKISFEKWYRSGKFGAKPSINDSSLESAIKNSELFEVNIK